MKFTYKKYLFLLILILCLFGCEGRDCIEADDFGEYNNDELNVLSVSNSCSYTYIDNSYDEVSEPLKKCLVEEKTSLSVPNSSCVINMNGRNCYELKDCIVSASSGYKACLSKNFPFFGGDKPSKSKEVKKWRVNTTICHNGDPDDSEDEEFLNDALEKLKQAYRENCLDNCQNTCINGSVGQTFEPDWVPNNYLNGNTGIKIGLSNTINVKAVGNVTLNSAMEKIFEFTPSIKIQQTPTNSSGKIVGFSKDAETFSVFGQWTNLKGAKVGETLISGHTPIQDTDYYQRYNFLKKGIVILKDVPEGGIVDVETNVYYGPDQFPNFSTWTCKYIFNDADRVTNVEDFSSIDIKEYACDTNYSGTFKANNEKLYPINKYFAKNIGGFVIPYGLSKYITSYPFKDITTNVNENKVLEISKIPESFTVSANNIDASTDLVIQNAFEVTQKGIKNKSLTYPSVVAFRNLFSNVDEEYRNPNKHFCTLKVSVEGNSEIIERVVEVPFDNKWHFLLDDQIRNSNGSMIDEVTGVHPRLILGSNRFYTLEKTKEDAEFHSMSNKYSVSVSVEGKNWKDAEGNTFRCGDGLVAFFIPLNEVLIEKSGFVSINNLLKGTALETCNKHETGEECYGRNNIFDIKVSIINKAINQLASLNESEKENNFYEYADETNRMFPIYKIFKLGDGWSNEIYLRKGQILRFKEDNWFYIYGSNNSYEIKQKVFDYESFTNSIAEGLIMKIDERPALICAGEAVENVENPACNVQSDENGNEYCAVSYTEYCSDYSSSPTTYCPYGCYPLDEEKAFFVDINDFEDGVCGLEKETIKALIRQKTPVSLTSCKTCQDKVRYESSKIGLPGMEMKIVQCYNLENYVGSVYNLFNSSYSIKENQGQLTEFDYRLGARKLDSIFTTSEFGNLESMSINVERLDKFIYSAEGGLKFTKPKTLHFMVIDNDNLEFLNDYEYNRLGKYSFEILPNLKYSFGEQLAIALADKNWNGNGDPKYWITKYNIGTNDINTEGTLAEDTPYYFNSNGKLLNSETNGEGISMSDISSRVNIAPSDYSNLRLWFKIVDKPEKLSTCPIGQVTVSKVYCKCNLKKNSEWRNCDNSFYSYCISDEDNVSEDNAIEQKVETECKDMYVDNNGSYKVKLRTENNSKTITANIDLSPINDIGIVQNIANNPITDIGRETHILPDSSNKVEEKITSGINAGIEGLNKVTSKVTTNIDNYSGYIIKLVLKPLMELLDGKMVAISIDSDGDPIPCQSTDNKNQYGGILPSEKIGNSCSIADPLYGIYCIKSPYCPNANIDNPKYCFLPGADKVKMQQSCTRNETSNLVNNIDYCFSTPNDKCVVYNKNSIVTSGDDNFGSSCKPGDKNCFRDCSSLPASLYARYCKTFSNGKGFVQTFYVAVITDYEYQVILKLCLTLMLTFYGLYYLLGMAEMTYAELIRRTIKIGFIYLMVGKDGWYYYNRFFVTFFKGGIDYIVFAIASSFDDSANLAAAFAKHNFYDKSVLFSGLDSTLTLILSDEVMFKTWGLLFISFFGWLYVFLIYSSIFTYIMASIKALIIYMTAQFFISFMLALGPIFFVLYVFERTSKMFNTWLDTLISLSLEQVFLLSTLSLFNTIIYIVIKLVLHYRVCWREMWSITLPIIGKFNLLHWWRATSATNPTYAGGAVPNLFQILLIYLVADLLEEFISIVESISTGMVSGAISGHGAWSDTLLSSKDNEGLNALAGAIGKYTKGSLKGIAEKGAKRLLGYQSNEEAMIEDKHRSNLQKGKSFAKKESEKAVNAYVSDNAQRLSNMSKKDREAELKSVGDKAYRNALSSDSKEASDYRAAKKALDMDDKDDLEMLNKNEGPARSLLGRAASDVVNKFFNKGTTGDSVSDNVQSSDAFSKEEKQDFKQAEKNKEIKNAVMSSGDGFNTAIPFTKGYKNSYDRFTKKTKEKRAVINDKVNSITGKKFGDQVKNENIFKKALHILNGNHGVLSNSDYEKAILENNKGKYEGKTSVKQLDKKQKKMLREDVNQAREIDKGYAKEYEQAAELAKKEVGRENRQMKMEEKQNSGDYVPSEAREEINYKGREEKYLHSNKEDD